jgi:hypothetical protein
MPANRTTRLSLLLLFVFLQMNHSSYSQVSLDSPEKWVKVLSETSYKGNEMLMQLDSTLNQADSARSILFMNELERNGRSKGYYFLESIFAIL